MIYDRKFLRELDNQRTITKYARITALNFAEQPLESIEGRVTAGSINIDGSSAVRRTCSLTIVAQDFDYRNYYWGLHTKFKLEIGLENFVNKNYPDIIWFKQGTFIITQFNPSRSTNNFSISITGKDKMCLLNGEVGGNIMVPTDFAQIDEYDDKGSKTTKKILIRDIIREAVHTYAGEPYHNIIINDLMDYAVELLEYRYDTPMYLYRRTNSNNFDNATLDGSVIAITEAGTETPFNQLPPECLEPLVNNLVNPNGSTQSVKIGGEDFYIAKIEYGDTAGYRETDLVYAGTLIANVGETITNAVLDKVKNMLGEFEYFYDVDGRFIFQKKESLVNTKWNENGNLQDESEYQESLSRSSSDVYIFDRGALISSFNNTPNLTNMKNDYAIWGERTSLAGGKVDIHLRYAIDTKPVSYKTLGGVEYKAMNCDWREIIYQMAVDHLAHNQDEDFETRLTEANGNLYPNGHTGYEHYYTDLLAYWRELYYPEEERNKAISQLQLQLKEAEKDTDKASLQSTIDHLQNDYYVEVKRAPWHKNVFDHPDRLNFWFDFISDEGELAAFNVKLVGARTKTVNETSIKSIYFRETPDVMFVDPDNTDPQREGYRYIQYVDKAMFSISAQGRSAKDKLDELLYTHGYCIETATITAIPIYYLQPNTRIRLRDPDSNLEGDYIISKMTIPLAYNGTMSITATKAAETIW